MVSNVVFFISAAAALIAGISMVISKNAVHSALFLVGSQIALAVLFLLQGAFFIAALQVIVYAGAIMVLFVFVIMLLGVDQKEALIEPLGFQRPIAAALGLILILEAIYLGVSNSIASSSRLRLVSPVNVPLPREGNTEALARVLFTKWAFPFEATSLVLVIAVVGVMVLAKRRVPTS